MTNLEDKPRVVKALYMARSVALGVVSSGQSLVTSAATEKAAARKVVRMLHARGKTVDGIAKLAKTSRAHLSLVFRNVPGRGEHVRTRVAPLLTEEELKVLGWNEFLVNSGGALDWQI